MLCKHNLWSLLEINNMAHSLGQWGLRSWWVVEKLWLSLKMWLSGGGVGVGAVAQ